MENKKLSKIRHKINVFWILCFPFIAACNNDSKKVLGLVGNATSEGLENLLNTYPSINNPTYSISTTSPEPLRGDGTNSLTVNVDGEDNASPDISGYPLLFFTFSQAGKINFTNISDAKIISIISSTAEVSLLNISNELEKVFITDTQSGNWNISYKPNSSGNLDLDWSNNTGISVDLTSLTINEVGNFLLKNTGNENITIPTFNLDPNDTEKIQIENDNDGDILIGAAANIIGTKGLKIISLKTLNDGNITLGTPGTSGLTDAQNINFIELNASKNGNINLGDLGTNNSSNKISNFLITTEGGSINVGTIKAKQIDNFEASGDEFSIISVGNIEIEEFIKDFTLSGDANISVGKFSGNGTVNLDASKMTKQGINLDFSDLKGSIDVTTTNQDDIILLGIESGKVDSGGGNDIITVLSNTAAKTDIVSGDGIDTITLSSVSGMDIINPGGTNINLINNSATTHNNISADKIINFDASSDKIIFGSTIATESNFISETNASSFADALLKSNSAMTLGKSYYLSYNVANASEGFGLLFHDIDDDGSSDIVLTLTGITTNIISSENLIII